VPNESDFPVGQFGLGALRNVLKLGQGVIDEGGSAPETARLEHAVLAAEDREVFSRVSRQQPAICGEIP